MARKCGHSVPDYNSVDHTFLIVRAKIAFWGSKWRQSLAPRHFILKRIKSGKCHLLWGQGYSEQGKKRKRWREDGDELKQYRKTQDCEGWTEEKVALHRPLRNTQPHPPPSPQENLFLGMESSKLFIGLWSWSNPRCGLLGLVRINWIMPITLGLQPTLTL